jgi:hypothetical protein
MTQRLGEILLAHGSIDTDQLQAALTHQRLQGRRLGASLVDLRLCSNDQVLAALAAQAGLPPLDLDHEKVDPAVAPRFLTRAAAEHFRSVPLHFDEQSRVLSVAVGAPATSEQLEDLRAATGVRALRAFLATDEAIARAIGKVYAPKPTGAPPLLVYGWSEEDGRTLVQGLAVQGIPARVASSAEVLTAGTKEIVLAPVSAMEALLGGGRCRSLLIAAAKNSADFPRAEKLDACSFLLAPLDMDCVVRAIQRCYQLVGVRPQRAA